MKLKTLLLLALALLVAINYGLCAEKVIFGFEKNIQGWGIPDWSLEKEDYKAQTVTTSNDFAEEGKSSLQVMVDFPGRRWSGAYVEIERFFDWSAYKTLSADVYLPKEAPLGLDVRFILTVGDNWTWTEMNSSAKLIPGEWTTVSADISAGSTDWKRTTVTDEFAADVRKAGIRIESKRIYAGPIYIDNIRLE